MEINITSLLTRNMFPLAHSQFEGGGDAWNASIAAAREIALLDTPEKLQAMREFALDSGGWTSGERAKWSDEEINALFLQWIAGDVRQMPGKSVEKLASAGGAAGNARVTLTEREPGQWWREWKGADGDDWEQGPYDTRSEAYADHSGREPRAESLDDVDWLEAEAQQTAGRISSNIYKGDDGGIYFYLGA